MVLSTSHKTINKFPEREHQTGYTISMLKPLPHDYSLCTFSQVICLIDVRLQDLVDFRT